MKKNLALSFEVIIILSCLISCTTMTELIPFSLPFSKKTDDGSLLKNYDTVNRVLETYRGKKVNELTTAFGQNYVEEVDSYTFYTPSEESFIKFTVKKDKVKSYSYDGKYSEIVQFVEGKKEFKNGELSSVANSWLGFSPDLLKENLPVPPISSTEKIIVSGLSETVCIEYTISSFSFSDSNSSSDSEMSSENSISSTNKKKNGSSDSSSSTSKSNSNSYIKKVTVKGTYDELKEYLVKVPEGSLPVKKIRQKNW